MSPSWLVRHTLTTYYVLADAISWTVARPSEFPAGARLRRVVAAAPWHASFNFVTASPAAAGFTAAVSSMLVVAWAVAVLVVIRLRELGVQPRSSQVRGAPTE